MFQPKYLIYALLDPWTGAVRYVGQSSNGLARPRAHFNPSSMRGQSYRANWLRNVRDAGLKYGILVLEVVNERSCLSDAERQWIAFGRASGWPLTNLTDGGDGAGPRPDLSARQRARRGLPGRVQTAVEIEKRRQTLFGNRRGESHKGRVYSPEALRRMTQSQRRRRGTPLLRINLLAS